MNDPLNRSEGSDVLKVLKKIILDEPNTSDNFIKEENSDKLYLDASLRITDKIGAVKDQEYNPAEGQSDRKEELFLNTEGCRAKALGVNQGDSDQSSNGNSLMEKNSVHEPETFDKSLTPGCNEEDFSDAVSTSSNPNENQNITESLKQQELRSIVVKIIREELRGSLGENITSNIRQMVNREIKLLMSDHFKP